MHAAICAGSDMITGAILGEEVFSQLDPVHFAAWARDHAVDELCAPGQVVVRGLCMF